MGCGCKKRRMEQQAENPSTIVFTENPPPRPPEPIPTPTKEEVDKIVEKLNVIFKNP